MQGRVQSPYPASTPMDMLYQSANRAEREAKAHNVEARKHEKLMQEHDDKSRRFIEEKDRHLMAIEDLKRIYEIDAAEAEARRLAEQEAEARRLANEQSLREAERKREWLEREQPGLVARLDAFYDENGDYSYLPREERRI